MLILIVILSVITLTFGQVTPTFPPDCTSGHYYIFKTNSSVMDQGYTDTAATAADCEALCSASSSCVAFIHDKDHAAPQCALVTDAVHKVLDIPGVSYYSKILCSDDKCEGGTFYTYFNNKMPVAAKVKALTAITTIELCVVECYAVSCLAFDYNEASGACNLYEGTTNPGNPVSSAGVTLYKAPDCYFAPLEDCFCEYNNQTVGDSELSCTGCSGSGDGGLPADTIDACIYLCSQHGNECSGVEYNEGTKTCHLHSPSTICDPFTQDPYLKHISRYDCSRPETCKKICPPTKCYCQYEDLRINGGVGLTTGPPDFRLDTTFTLTSCADACFNYKGLCYGFDYNKDHKTCHIHLSATSCVSFVTTPTLNVVHGNRDQLCTRSQTCTQVCPP